MAEVRSLSKPDAMTIRLLWKSSTTAPASHRRIVRFDKWRTWQGKARRLLFARKRGSQVDQDDSAEAHRALPAKFHEKSGRECPIQSPRPSYDRIENPVDRLIGHKERQT